MPASPTLVRIPLAMLVATLLATLGLLVSASSASALTCTDASLFNMPPANAPLPGSCFEAYDGDQVDPDGAVPAPAPPNRLDWQSAIGTSGLVRAPDYVVGKNDSQFGPGGAEETPDSWTFNIGSLGSDKYDALAAWTFREPSTTDLFLALAFVRASNNGETHLSFELNQKQPGYRTATETGTGGRTIKVPTRSTGDLLITYSVGNNDAPPRLGLCKWSGDEHSGHWQDFAGVNVGDECPALLPAVAQASLNQDDIDGAQNYLQPGTDLDTGQFAEASINLSEALKAAGGNPNQPDPCVSFGYMWLHSRSAPSITSNQQDYILPSDAINVANCAVTGKKFHDVDGDGLPQEGNEPGLGGWTIFADYDNDGVLDNDKAAPFVNDNDGVVEPGEEEPYDVTAPTNGNDLRPTGSYTIANLQNGTWNIREVGQAGWSCTFPNPCGHQVVMTGKLVENINFGNNQPGKIRVVKSTTPDGDTTDFDFDPSVNLAAGDFTLRDGQAAQEYTVQAGSYSVSELAESGWDLDSIVCSDADSAGQGSTATFKVAAGEVVTCTFANVKRGSVRVVKSTDPDGDATEFEFDPSENLAGENFTRADNQAAKEFSVEPGTYSVSELAESGWDLSGIACSDADSSGNGSTATFKVAAGETVTCTFTNLKRGTIEIEKQTDPDEPAQTPNGFTFTGSDALAANSNLDPKSFDLADDGVKIIGDVKPNNGGAAYEVSEATEIGYRLSQIDCGDDADSGGSTESRKAGIHVSPGETVHCTFTNTKLNPSTLVLKEGTQQAHHGDLLTYTFDVTNTGNSPLHDVRVTDDRCSPVSETPTSKVNDDGDDLLELGEHWVFTCTYDAPAQHGTEEEDPIHNIATATAKDEQDQPVSATDEHDTDLLHPAIEVDKTLRRGDSGDFVQGPIQVHEGDTIEYRFEVTNEGDTPLAVGFEDPRCDAGSLSGPTGDGDQDGKLDLTETWVYRCSHAVTAESGDPVENTVTVTGTDSIGGPKGSDKDTDSAEADVLHPAIEVDKTLRRGDSGDFVQGPIQVHEGDTIEYRFEVTNEGDTPLAVGFEDPRCDAGSLSGPTGDGDQDGKLDLTETWVYRCSHAVTAESGDPVENTVTVTGTDDLGGKDTDKDSADADVLHPDIEVDKQVDRAKAHVGDTLSYAFVVTNAGDAPLAVEFSDPRCDAGTLSGPTGDTDGDGRLDVEETWTYKCTHVVTDGDPNPLPNTATVTGTDELGGKDTDEDSTSVAIVKPAALVIKEGNQFAYPGETVTFTFAVTNNGNAPLTDVVVTDDRCAPVTRVSGDAALDPGETWNYTCSKQIPAGHKIGDENPIRNVATATGKDELGKTVTATDDHLVRVLHPAVDIEKTGPATALAGDALAFTLAVTNPGDVPFAAQAVVVTDPRCQAPPAGPNTGADATPGQLDPGDTWTYTCTAQTAGQPAGTFVNTATVTAKDFNGRTVSDTDEFPTLLEAQGVLPSPEVISGRARLRGPSGCVYGPFTATVRGRRIASVTFYRDGKQIKTINARRGQRVFRVRIAPGNTLGIHRVTARIRFRAGSRTRARTLRLSYQRCRQQVVRPRFTG